MNARDDQVESYDKMWYLNLYGLAEIPMTLSMLSMDSRHIMLEGGCGTGRMTRDFAKRCHRLISVDFSLQSLRVNSAKLQAHHIHNVDLIQADLCRLPVRSEVIDRVASCGVLEHIPTQECRLAAVKDLTRVLKHGGAMAMSAYNHSLFTRLFGEKEGEHDGGIYYLRFSRNELRALLSQAIRVETITSSLVYYHMARCVKTGISS
jgi:ubiquinone/menaquinone biosynthesis C-methylase UbiE